MRHREVARSSEPELLLLAAFCDNPPCIRKRVLAPWVEPLSYTLLCQAHVYLRKYTQSRGFSAVLERDREDKEGGFSTVFFDRAPYVCRRIAPAQYSLHAGLVVSSWVVSCENISLDLNPLKSQIIQPKLQQLECKAPTTSFEPSVPFSLESWVPPST